MDSQLGDVAPTIDDFHRIHRTLAEIKRRMLRVMDTFAEGLRRDTIEQVALDLRMTLESIVLLSFVTHRPLSEQVESALARASISDARKRVRDLNPSYWPHPVEVVGTDYVDVEHGYLREKDWGRAFGDVSTVLHAPNPFAYSDRREFVEPLTELAKKLLTLTDLFIIDLADTGLGILCVIGYDYVNRPPDVRVMLSQEKWPREVETAIRMSHQQASAGPAYQASAEATP
ncbi:MAG: hypothetical protein J0I33_07510 [Microbacterium ginsengisoli]|uniref:hypothetical protein n=1 Tax=Microbacterium TaxID=33882 RepID=UPI000ABE4282|nr:MULTISPECIES: hypothetical protein [unclassified Microbacterium]MBN9198470.1 hypothetical protein [Microbacterium ginsengisoli]